MAAKSEKQTFLVVTAGQSRVGKSTAMNNIMGANFKAECSASSVTTGVDVRCVDMETTELIVVDIPGLAATDIQLKKVKKEVLSAIEGLNFVLVYCYSVSPSSSQSIADEFVVKNLQKILGKDVWERCVLLFTHSDTLRQEEYPGEKNREDYKALLRRHAERLSEMLCRVCGSHVPDVKVVFDVQTGQTEDTVSKAEDVSQEEDFKINLKEVTEIVAVPVGKIFKERRERHLLLPNMKNTNWKTQALLEILRKAGPIDPKVLPPFASESLTETGCILGGLAGAAAGVVVGTIVGTAAGGIGAIPGAVVGCAAGATVGTLGGGSGVGIRSAISKSIYVRKKERQTKKIDDLTKAERINFAPDMKALPFQLDPEDPDMDYAESSTELAASLFTHAEFIDCGPSLLNQLPSKLDPEDPQTRDPEDHDPEAPLTRDPEDHDPEAPLTRDPEDPETDSPIRSQE